MESCIYDSPLGKLRISGSENGITEVIYLSDESLASEVPECLSNCVQQLKEYFEGKRIDFSVEVNPVGTDFQKRVWTELLNIPFGQTISYMQLAQRLGDPKAVRAVGHANGQNRINILIPCHRVIGSGGKLTGYGGGLWRKDWLLKHEAEKNAPGLFDTSIPKF
ncbi:MAG: methylated-DNA--[protein]-cysteine S-methyltransferase [Bacteroidales bacterium]|nr:methylated-DNA--[protein]-cysteine S-methyltransferase [Bacteroidales bacterium]